MKVDFAMMENETEKDANLRILEARTCSLVDATDVYVARLRAQLVRWVADLDEEIAARAEKAQKLNEEV